jgi:hypothetical protein
MKKIFEAKLLESKQIEVPEFNLDDATVKLEGIFKCKPNIQNSQILHQWSRLKPFNLQQAIIEKLLVLNESLPV